MTPYRPDGFDDHFDDWVVREQPSEHLRAAVLNWMLSRCEQPYDGVGREAGFENLWYGRVPGTEQGAGLVVVCAYFIHEREHRLQCSSIGTIGLPI